MISVEEAKQLLFAQIKKSTPIHAELVNANGCVLAEDIFSPIDLPSFNQSSMDGYAIAWASDPIKQFDMVGEIKAGDHCSVKLNPGEAVRIFTGAEVPATADAVIIQEKTERKNGSVYFSGEVKKGDCIRFRGSQIKKGELALEKNTILNPASIGFVASLGLTQICIYKKPEVSVIVTGNEITSPGNNLQPGHIYESNSFSLAAALQQMHIITKMNCFVADDLKETKATIEKCLAVSDIVILTGGISVGDYDVVHEAITSCGVEQVFYKVAQKPGKPFFAGELNEKIIFALPGNPAAVLVCFYEYIYPVIRMMQGFENTFLPVSNLKLLTSVSNKEGRSQFMRAKKMNDGVIPLEKQDSNMLRSFAEADCLIYLPSEIREASEGETVEVHTLPFQN